jgi:hypothetical protein
LLPTMSEPTRQPHSFTVFKDARGDWRWLARTTTAFEDRDREVLSLKALEADVARADADGKYGPLRYWHIGIPDPYNADAPWGWGLDLGWCDFNMMIGRTLVESGTFNSEAIARWAAKTANDHGLSPGFFHPQTEPDRDGVFGYMRRFERSLAPHERVSNLFTDFFAYSLAHATKETTMPLIEATKIKTLLQSGFSPDIIAGMLDKIEQTEKTADAAGVRFKEAAPTNPALDQIAALEQQLAALKAAVEAPVTVKADAPMGDTAEADDDAAEDAAMLDTIGAMLDSKLSPIITALSSLAGSSTTAATKTAQLEQATSSELATLKAQQATLHARIADLEGGQTRLQSGHIASQSAATVTTKAEALAVDSQPQPLGPIDDVLEWTRKTIPAAIAGSIGS